MSDEERTLIDDEDFWLQHTHNHILYSAALSVFRRNLTSSSYVLELCEDALRKSLRIVFRDNEVIIKRCLEILLHEPSRKGEVILAAVKKLHLNKWEFFVEICKYYPLTNKELAQILRFTWINSNIPQKMHQQAERFFHLISKEDIMTDKECWLFNELPQMVTIYRGCSYDEPDYNNNQYHPSWSLEYKTAEDFAFHLDKYYDNDRRCVVRAVVPKSQILCFFDNSLKEVVVFGVTKSDAEIIQTYFTYSDE